MHYSFRRVLSNLITCLIFRPGILVLVCLRKMRDVLYRNQPEVASAGVSINVVSIRG